MRSLFIATLLVVSASANADSLPSAVGRADLLNEKLSGWQGSVLIIDTPDTSGLLTTVIAPIGEDVIKNDSLISKESTPGFDQLANVYNVKVEQNESGSAVISNWRDMGSSLWSVDYTVSKRNGKFVITGFNYTFDYQKDHGKCSINFSTGQAVVNNKHIKTAPRVIEFATARDATIQSYCEKLLGQ